jgi:hypothetical protein
MPTAADLDTPKSWHSSSRDNSSSGVKEMDTDIFRSSFAGLPDPFLDPPQVDFSMLELLSVIGSSS